ncbi:MAG: 50S ribosomal protein L18 [Acidobacteriota bacterium]
MSANSSRNARRKKIHHRIRNKIQGTKERPRLCVYRSLVHIYAQLVDDFQGQTLAAASTLKLEGKKATNGRNLEAAKKVGKALAEQARSQGIEQVVFDRSGYIYHGRVKALAEAAREAGLKF